MNAPFDRAQVFALPWMPAEFEVLAPPPLLLPGESLEQYHLTRQAILSEIAPRSAIELLPCNRRESAFGGNCTAARIPKAKADKTAANA